jgi:hypothetical protein
VDQPTLSGHQKTKGHKQRIKALKEAPYTVEEAEAAGGVGVYDRNRFLGAAKVSKKKAAFDSGIVVDP